MAWHRKFEEAALACGIVLSLVVSISGASAFTQEPVAPPSAATQSPQAQAGAPQAQMGDPFPQGAKSGTEVNIPGIGSVGTLPKLDFGLELLYGPKGSLDSPQVDQGPQDNDVKIKGTFTHKF